MLTGRKLRRIDDGSEWFGGVCGGIAYWLGVPTWLVRLLLIISIFGYGVGILPYILLWILLPKWPETPKDFANTTED